MLFDRIKNSRLFRPLLEEVRKQNGVRAEILKGMTFNSTIVDSPWLKYKSFSPGLWAADYGLLYTLYRALNSMKPKSLVEFGLGQSSKMVHQYANHFQVEAVTFEHDPDWVKFFNEGRDGDYDIRVQLAELETIRYKGFDTVTYKGLEALLAGKTFDFVLVDGPFGSDHYSRPEVLDGWMEIVRKLRPREIMVYTIDRPTPAQNLQKISADELRRLVQPLIDEGFQIQIKG